jgi:hypothetical protein
MTSIIPFIPSNIVTPKFKAMFDGTEYEVSVTWNLSALRYYINVYDLNGIWIITVPLISSPSAREAVSAVYDPFLNAMTVEMKPYSFWNTPYAGIATKPGTMIDYTLHEFQPSTYNGQYRCLHLNPSMFTFPMPTNPGPLVILGRVSRMLNMVASVFNTSTLIYRNGAFEVSP